MATIVTRSGKGSPLTNNEVDANFTNLNTDKAELSGATFTGEITANGGIALGDNDKAIFGAGNDLQIYSDGGSGIIQQVANGVLLLKGQDFYVQNDAGSNYIRAEGSAQVDLYYGGVKKFETTSTGIDVTGVITTDGMTTSADINFGDDDKALFGAGNDLKIYHSANNQSYIHEAGTGDLNILASNFKIQNGAGTENKIVANTDGAVSLYYDNSAKLATTTAGIDVTGTIVGDGLTVDGDAAVAGTTGVTADNGTITTGKDSASSRTHWSMNNPNGEVAKWDSNGTDLLHYITDEYKVYTAGNKAFEIDGNGDISFYEDTGTTPKLFWDASAESLELGTSSSMTPSASLAINEAINTPAIEIIPTTDDNNADSASIRLWGTRFGTANRYSEIRNVTDGSTANNELAFDTNGSERLRIDSSGRVGIGTSSPSAKLHVSSSGDTIARITSADGNGAFLDLGDASDPDGGRIVYDSGSNLGFSTASTERMRINSAGNVGIGTSSPNEPLTVSGNILAYGSTGNVGSGVSHFFGNNSNSRDIALTRVASGTLGIGRYSGGWQETARFDSSGNLLVGKTSTGVTTQGVEARSTGLFAAVRSDGTVGYFGRLTSDGDILNFRKDGTTVGSIGTVSSGDLYIADGRNAGIKLDGGNNQILPVTSSGSPLDATLDLGVSGARFKDLYLSGQAYASYLRPTAGSTDFINFSSGAIRLATGGSESARIDTSGNLLVGKTSASKDTIGAELKPDGRINATMSSGNPLLLNRKTSDGAIIDLQKDGTTVGSIGTDSNSQFMIGSGDTGLTFQSNNDAIIPRNTDGTARTQLINLGTSGAQFKDLYLSGTLNGDKYGIHTEGGGSLYQTNGYLRFANGNTETARIDSSGNLLVGTTEIGTVPDGARLMNDGQVRFTSIGTVAYLNRSGTAGTIQEFRQANTSVGYISVTGSATSYNTSSDQRLKENIADADDAGSKIDAIQVRKFDWKADGSHQDYGMIAQELQSVAPEAVSGDADSEEMMGVDYSKLVPMLIKEIQSLRNRVAQLEE